jgi:pectate lyase
MKRILFITLVACSTLSLTAADYDQNKPFGFCTVSSRTDASNTYNVTGGGCYTYPVTEVSSDKVITLTSTGKDMKTAIANAIKNYNVIIFDGSKGDFIVSSNMELNGIKDKTLLGINQARLCTKWYINKEIIDSLNAAGVPTMSTSEGGGTLSNGRMVKEEAEYNTRQIIINMTGDQKETYRKAGIFVAKGCQNIIFRNLILVGPGSIDVGGSDLMSFVGGTRNCWVDHCEFIDGMDGNFDIGQSSDFNTVSWCTFSYTDRSYMHQNTNLIGSGDKEPTGYLNTTFAFNWWGTGCKQRMPMARVGKIHMLNNYFSSTTANNCINPRNNSEVLIEGNYFDKGVKKYYSQNGAISVTWADSNYAVENNKGNKPTSIGEVVIVPYEYTVASSRDVPTVVRQQAGAKLF